MEAIRIHLLITHLPVFGLLIGVLSLIYGLIKKNQQVKILSLAIMIMAMIGGVIAFKTGHEAEETVEHISGVAESVIEEHEEAAEITILLMYALGMLLFITLYSELKNSKFSRSLMLLVVVISLATFLFVARTAALGGKIRHTEITKGGVNQYDQHEHKEIEDDE